ncbi:MAG: immunoglobulin domain-containing protein [Verrucomicrobia bacterium]|nr:immunoglobulin domain-containing protein [Verrucomicrobiota bacterium]
MKTTAQMVQRFSTPAWFIAALLLAASTLAPTLARGQPVSPPVITQGPPTNRQAVAGSTVVISVTATGTPPLSYQWKHDGTNLMNGPHLGGTRTATLTISNVQPPDWGAYSVVVTNAAGARSANGFLSLGPLMAWGTPNYGTIVLPPGLNFVRAIAAGAAHALAVRSNGSVVMWGSNPWGPVPPGLSNVVAVSAGTGFSVALKSDGTVTAWGWGLDGETNVAPGLNGVVAIDCGSGHTIALRSDGTVVTWGYNPSGRLNVPPGLRDVVAVSAGGAHNLALKADGTVVGWGWNDYGQTDAPAGLNNVVAIAAGGDFSVVLKADGTVRAWGGYYYGQDSPPPGLSNVVAIAAGYDHALALRADGSVIGWGNNYMGAVTIPPGLNNVTGLGAGGEFEEEWSLVLRSDGRPVVLAQPSRRTAVTGETVAFRALAVGQPPLAYQWFFNGQAIVGASNATLTIPAVQPERAGAYSFRISNPLGSNTSAEATLTIVPVVPTPTLGEALDTPHLVWSTGGAAAWVGQTNITHDGVDAAQTRLTEMETQSWLETTVQGPGELSFLWKTYCNGDFDLFRFLTNGQEAAVIWAQYDMPWQQRKFLLPAGVHTLRWVYEAHAPQEPQFGAWLDQVGFAMTPSPVTLVSTGAVWKYSDAGVDLGTAWRAAGFDDLGWPSGPAQLGFGDGDEATVIRRLPDGLTPLTTAYFRHFFVLTNAAAVNTLMARLTYDDGAVVYLNGAEATRVNMPPGPTPYATLATSVPPDNALHVTSLSPSLLVNGLNVVAVEVHQANITSSDLSFDFELTGMTGLPTTNRPPSVALVSPTNGATFQAPANIVLIAQAQDPDGFLTIQTVEFFAGTNRLGVRTNFPTLNPLGPFVLEWPNVPAGAYTLIARATDNTGNVGVSAPVNIVVRPALVPAVVSIAATENLATEQPSGLPNFNSAVFTVTRRQTNGAPLTTGPLSVFYAVSGPASNGVDYAALPGMVSFAEGASNATILVTSIDDALGEGTESVALNLVPSPPTFAPNWYFIGSPSNATAYILDDETPPPVITIEATDPMATETPTNISALDNALFTIRRAGELGHPLELWYAISGTASNGVDYRPLSGRVTLPPRTNQTRVVVLPLDDSLVEGPETLRLELLPPPPGAPWGLYQLGVQRAAEAEIRDNDSPTNSPPTVSILTPTNGAVFLAGANILLGATAHDTNGVTGVEFFDGTNRLGRADGPLRTPYGEWILIWSNAPPGAHVLTARAVDQAGRTGTSAPVNITVSAHVPPTVTCPAPMEVRAGSNGLAHADVFVSLTNPRRLELAVTWTVDSVVVSTSRVSGMTSAVGLAHDYPLGQHVVGISVSDGQTPPASCSTTVSVLPPLLVLPRPTLPAQPMSYASFVISANGILYGWGGNSFSPQPLPPPIGIAGWKVVSSGYEHTLAIAANHQLYARGANAEGQLGVGDTLDRSELTPVLRPDNVDGWSAVAAGGYHSLALSKEGRLYQWGGGKFPRQTIPTLVTTPVGVTRWLAVAAGQNHSLALADTGELYGWGENELGQLGDGTAYGFALPLTRAVRPAGVARWKTVAAGAAHTLAIADDDRLYAWGGNWAGQLGANMPANSALPVLVPPAAGVTGWSAIAAGQGHSLAITSDGRLFGWGANYTGQVGIGSTNLMHVPTPTLVSLPAGVTNWWAVGAGYWHSLAVGHDCQVYAWGGNGSGQLGFLNGGYAAAPRLVSGLGDLCNAVSNMGPVVTWGSPPDGAVFGAFADIPLSVNATDHDGQVVSAEFYANGQPIGTVSCTGLCSRSWHQVPPGAYVLTARAVDNLGARGESPPIHITVSSNLPPTVTCPAPMELRAGSNGLASANVSVTITNADRDDLTVTWTVDGVVVLTNRIDGSNAPASFQSLFGRAYAVGLHVVSVSVSDGQAPPASCSTTVTVRPSLPTRPGGLDPTFHFTFLDTAEVLSSAWDEQGRLVIGGTFTTINGTPQKYVARIVTEGTPRVDETFDASAALPSWVRTLALQAGGGKVLVGCDVVCGANLTNFGVARLNADGLLDSTFHPPFSPGSYAPVIAVEPSGRIIIGGSLGWHGNTPTFQVVRLLSTGDIGDTSFATSLNGVPLALLPTPDGKLLMGGAFTLVGGLPRHGLARLNSDGTVDTTFNPGTGTDGAVFCLARQPDGRILIGGEFSQVNGIARGSLARLNTNGSVDLSFHASIAPFAEINALLLQPDGKVVVGGEGDLVGTDLFPHGVARLNPDGSMDATFDPGTGLGGEERAIYTMALQRDGRIILGGQFESYDGATYGTLVRVLGDAGHPPIITTQPVSLTCVVGQTAVLSIIATGAPPVSFRWWFNGAPMTTGTNATLVLSNVQPGHAGNYRAVVSNPGGSVTSVTATLTVTLPGESSVVAWGEGLRGETDVPPGLNQVISVAAGAYHSLALRVDGSIVGWGAGTNCNPFMSPDVCFGQSIVPPFATNVATIGAGWHHSLGLRRDGTLFAWGAGTNPTGTSPHYGQSIVPPGLSNVATIAVGGGHNLALKPDGSVVAWGYSNYGQTSVPPGLSNVVTMAAGGYHNLALKSDGTVVGWGWNAAGQISLPAALGDVTDIAAGNTHSLALRSDGTVVSWGYLTNVPSGLSNVVAIAAGTDYSLALKRDGTVVGWGFNQYGQSTPPAGLSNVVAISAKGHHSLAATGFMPPRILTQPLNQNVVQGRKVIFKVSTSGSHPFAYQWRFNGVTIPGATNAVLSLSQVQPSSAGAYSVAISNPFGAVTSAVATLTVATPQPAIPRITAFSPRTAPAGTPVAIVGTNFASTPALNTVYFGAVKASVLGGSANTLSVIVPPGATYAPISVTVNGRTSWSRDRFNPTFTGSGLMSVSAFVPMAEDLATGDGPVAIVAADFDGDGKPDLAVANRFEHTLSIYQSVSVPGVIIPQSFAPPFKLATGLNPTELAAADLDGDGRLDLVVINADADTVSAFRNVATPSNLSSTSFAPRVDVATGRQPIGLAVGDVDGDGRPDVVTANHGDNTFSVLRNLASPGILTSNSFALRMNFGAGAGPHSIALGDLNNDGRLDAVMGNFDDNTISVLPNQPTPGDPLAGFTFGLRVDFPAGGRTVAIGDLDGDGGPDIVSGSWTGNTVSLLRKNPAISTTVITTNSFFPAVTLNTGGYTHNVALGDLDGDGKPDLAVVTEMPSQLLLYHNGTIPGRLTAADFSQRTDFATGWNAVGVILADLDLDGKMDVTFANHYDDSIRIYRNTNSQPPAGFVHRAISASEMRVRLTGTPATNVSVYAVEDQPPANWFVTNISHGGVFDAATGKVKFGPFYDATPRTLSYDVLPPPGTQGVFAFTGTASADGVNGPIGGDQHMALVSFHPAEVRDSRPANWQMTIDEVTAYASAWRRGLNWIVPPHVIPIDYVTRAGALWRGGECYQVNPTVTNAPLWWVSCGSEISNLKSQIPNPVTQRFAPAAYVPGELLVVTVSVSPATAQAYAVAEQLPPGWTVASISDGGEFDTVNRTVKWGPFLDAAPRTLSYQATPPSTTGGAVSVAGVASFDGTSQVISGAALLAEGCRVRVAAPARPGPFQLTLTGRPGVRLIIEVSSDLTSWTALGEVTLDVAPAFFDDPAATQFPQRFYRAREER